MRDFGESILLLNLGLSFEEMANPLWFESNPKLAWAFYGHRLNLYRNTIPHEGFSLLLNLVKKKEDYFIFTSNVDGQFQKAGFDENKIVEIHGSIHHLQCTNNCNGKIWKNNAHIEISKEFQALNFPYCPKCRKIARPNILMFGDWSWNDKRTYKQQILFNKFIQKAKNKKLVIIEIGAGTAIPTVRIKSETLAKSLNGFLIRINPRDYEVKNGISVIKGGLDGIKEIL